MLHMLDIIPACVVQLFKCLSDTRLKRVSFDLKAAYEQLPIAADALKHAYL